MNQITNMLGVTYRVGQRVKCFPGNWIGTITAIKGDNLLVNPDNLNDVPEYQRWGKPDFCLPRDNGQSMGNFEPLT